jgi:16S rRNA (adenine1518-N6/adenine1519-N6)-dimethyltransferase
MPTFVGLVRLAFAQRRKTLRNALGSGWGKDRAAEVLAASGIEERTRAEELGLADFLRLYGAWVGERTA